MREGEQKPEETPLGHIQTDDLHLSGFWTLKNLLLGCT